MPWLALNGLNIGSLVAVADQPKSDRRDIGDMSPAGDGSMRVTRQARKRDLKFTSVPLTGADAYAWEALLIGEGEVWAFDKDNPEGLYGSKGLGPSTGYNASIVSGPDGGVFPRFGGGRMRLPLASGTVTFGGAARSIYSTTLAYTVMVWRYESPSWRHYIVRSDGAKWLDGVRNDAVSTTWLSESSGDITLANVSGSFVDYDDLVVLPYKIIDAWAAVFGTATQAFSPLPFLNATGDLVQEATSRRVLGSCSELVMVAVLGGVRRKDARVLDVELKAV